MGPLPSTSASAPSAATDSGIAFPEVASAKIGLSVVVPVYHNAASLPELLAALQTVAAELAPLAVEFVAVDDGSADDSWTVLERLAATEPRLRLVKLSRNFGSNPALRAGLARARGQAVVGIAADLQDPPALIPEMVRAWQAGAKVVVAARRRRADPWHVRLPADLFYRLLRSAGLPTMPPRGFDFFLLDRQVVQVLTALPEVDAYLMGLILWTGFRPAVLEYDRQARPARFGRSMWTLPRRFRYALDALFGFTAVPLLPLVAAAAVLFFLAIWAKLAQWETLWAAVFLLGGLQMLASIVLAEYLRKIHRLSQGRPNYLVDRVIEPKLGETDAWEASPPARARQDSAQA